LNFYLTAILLGLGFSALALGIYISLRVFNIPDITTDGSFTLGGAVTAVLLLGDMNPLLIIPIVFLAGGLSGVATAFIHTRLKVNALLSGILVMTALYSINLALMGRSNLPLIGTKNIFQPIQTLTELQSQLIILFIISALLCIILWWILRTDFGLAMRATGNNETMIRALGVNTNRMKIIGLALANGLTALSGYLIVQLQGFADINMGIGIVILGLGSVMIGEIMVFRKTNNILMSLIGVIVGAIIFRLILAFALSIGIDALYLKLIVALLVLVVISIPAFRKSF
jgi:putative ABC transport system permease protein